MSWTKLDDLWTERVEALGLTLAARWHYLALIQRCSRLGVRDGTIRRVDARRASDVEDPGEALAELTRAGLLRNDGSTVTVVNIAEHIPSEAQLAKTAADRERQQRHRAHKKGDHSLCDPRNCDVLRGGAPSVTRDVTPPVTRDVGTGRDGTGQARPRQGDSAERDSPEPELDQGTGTYGWGEVHPDDAEFFTD